MTDPEMQGPPTPRRQGAPGMAAPPTSAPRSAPGTRSAPGPRSAPEGAPGPRSARRAGRGRPEPAPAPEGGARAALIRAGELSACCVSSLVVVFVGLAVVLGLAVAVYEMTK